MPDTEKSTGSSTGSSFDSLRAIWAAGEQPHPVLPWYRRVSRARLGFAAAALAVVTLAVLGLVSLDRPARRAELPIAFAGFGKVAEDQDLTRLRARYEADNSRRFGPGTVELAAYGPAGSTGTAKAALLAVAWNHSVPDAAREATRLLGGYVPGRDGELGDGTHVVGLRTVDPGRLGGAIACATLRDEGYRDVPVCTWADGSTSGSLTDLSGTLTPDELADRTRELRELADRPA